MVFCFWRKGERIRSPRNCLNQSRVSSIAKAEVIGCAQIGVTCKELASATLRPPIPVKKASEICDWIFYCRLRHSPRCRTCIVVAVINFQLHLLVLVLIRTFESSSQRRSDRLPSIGEQETVEEEREVEFGILRRS